MLSLVMKEKKYKSTVRLDIVKECAKCVAVVLLCNLQQAGMVTSAAFRLTLSNFMLTMDMIKLSNNAAK